MARVTPRIPALVLVALLTALVGLTACSSDKPAVCDDADALRQSVDNLKEVQIGDNALSTLSSDVSQIQQDVKHLGSDAKSEFGGDVDQVSSAATQLEDSVNAAKANPSASTLGAVGTAIQSFGTSVDNLVDAVKDTC
jgi:hypothetical protein